MTLYLQNDLNVQISNFGWASDGTLINDAQIVTTVTVDTAATITAASNAAPIAITTSAAHGLSTGDVVVVTEVTGNTAANGRWTVTVVSPTQLTLNGSSGSGAWLGAGKMYKAIPNATALTTTYTGTPGEYLCVIPKTAALLRDADYRLFCYASNYGYWTEQTIKARIRNS